jgi:hypothetical protein
MKHGENDDARRVDDVEHEVREFRDERAAHSLSYNRGRFRKSADPVHCQAKIDEKRLPERSLLRFVPFEDRADVILGPGGAE